VTEVAAAARRTLGAGSARVSRAFGREGAAPTVHEGVADIAGRRAALGPPGEDPVAVFADGRLRLRGADGVWTAYGRRRGEGDPLAILDALTRATSQPVTGGEEDVRGVPCERVDVLAADARLASGRVWIGPDDRIRRVDWASPGELTVSLQLWDFGVEAEIEVPPTERRARRGRRRDGR
jgi:hypothetical protein